MNWYSCTEMLKMRGSANTGNLVADGVRTYSISDWSRRVNLFNLALSASVWFLTM